jgi:hypothetical protein
MPKRPALPSPLFLRSLRSFAAISLLPFCAYSRLFSFAFCGYSFMRGHIVAFGGGGFSMEPDNLALDRYILSLWRNSGREPRICFIPTASGDSADYINRFYSAFEKLPCRPTHLVLTGLLQERNSREKAQKAQKRKKKNSRERTQGTQKEETLGGEPDFAPSFETPGGYVGQAALVRSTRSRGISHSPSASGKCENRRVPSNRRFPLRSLAAIPLILLFCAFWAFSRLFLFPSQSGTRCSQLETASRRFGFTQKHK